jgi:hypothetical protein
MNPLASYKCAGRLLMALAAISSIVLAVGCGSSNSVAPNNNDFSDSSLNGTYVLSISGIDVNAKADTESFFAIVGTITADGKGNITGTVDINDPDLGSPGVFLGQTLTASTYNITQDGRGTGSLSTPEGNFGLDFVLTSTGHGLITRFDGNGTGSGTLDLQTSTTQTSLTSLAFSLSGSDLSGNPLGTVGAFTLNSSGTITPAGLQDFNDNGDSATSGPAGLALTGSLVLSSGGTSGTAVLTTSSGFGSLGFDVWVIDSTHLKLIETDTSGPVLSGDAFTQQTSFTTGQLVFTVAGLDLNGDPVAAGGFVTTDAGGDLSAGNEDYNNAGTAAGPVGFTGSCATFVAGRCQLNSLGFTNGAVSNLAFAAYPSSAGVLLLEDDNTGILQGTAYSQTATAFTAPASYGLNLSGANSDGEGDVGEVDDIAQFNATATASPAINMTGVLDDNSLLGGPFSPASLSGTYTPDSPATGRGSITVPTIATFIGTLNLEYYVVNSSTAVFIDGDQEQVAVGTFEAQSTSGSAAAAQSRISMVRLAVRPHATAAFPRK